MKINSTYTIKTIDDIYDVIFYGDSKATILHPNFKTKTKVGINGFFTEEPTVGRHAIFIINENCYIKNKPVHAPASIALNRVVSIKLKR